MSIQVYNRGEFVDFPFFQFPGGELHMKVDRDYSGKNVAVVKGANVDDYMMLALWARTVKSFSGEAHAVIPYFPAARSDRGVPCGADVYADLIKLAPLDSVRVMDPHSYYVVDGIDWGKIDFRYTFPYSLDLDFLTGVYDIVIAPDKGAVERASYFADKIGAKVVLATKERDFETGELLKFACPDLPDYSTVLVVDDIGDGCGTFNGLADVIRDKNSTVTLDLFVTHGIFSQGFDALNKRFSCVMTTDSLNPRADNYRKIQEMTANGRYYTMPVVNKMIQSI